ncbi:MAG: phosphatase PAP2 family protein [Burkholderiales bacterium]
MRFAAYAMPERFTIRLPAIRSRTAKYAAGMSCILISALLYLVPNTLYTSSGVALRLSAIDRIVPFWPASGWLYASIYLFLLWTFINMRDLNRVSRFLYACVFAQFAAAAVFVLYPVVYPRELFPVPAGTHPWNEAFVHFWRSIDRPANCVPSLHVSTSLLCAVAFERTRRADVATVLVLAMLFSVSTLTFKQHYVVDVVTGLGLGLVSYWIFFRWGTVELTAA